MSQSDALISLGSILVGGLIAFFVSRYFFRRGSARSTLVLTLEELAQIDPSTVGVAVEMKVGRFTVSNLLVLELRISNRGPSDIDVSNPNDPDAQQLRPRIELPPGIRSLTDPWSPTGAMIDADVRVARSIQQERQVLHVHVHRLAAGAQATVRILCTNRDHDPAPEWNPLDLRLSPGFLPNVDVRAEGLLAKAQRASLPLPRTKAGPAT